MAGGRGLVSISTFLVAAGSPLSLQWVPCVQTEHDECRALAVGAIISPASGARGKDRITGVPGTVPYANWWLSWMSQQPGNVDPIRNPARILSSATLLRESACHQDCGDFGSVCEAEALPRLYLCDLNALWLFHHCQGCSCSAPRNVAPNSPPSRTLRDAVDLYNSSLWGEDRLCSGSRNVVLR